MSTAFSSRSPNDRPALRMDGDVCIPGCSTGREEVNIGPNFNRGEVRNGQERRQPVRKVPVRQVAREIARENEHGTSSCRFDLRHRPGPRPRSALNRTGRVRCRQIKSG